MIINQRYPDRLELGNWWGRELHFARTQEHSGSLRAYYLGAASNCKPNHAKACGVSTEAEAYSRCSDRAFSHREYHRLYGNFYPMALDSRS